MLLTKHNMATISPGNSNQHWYHQWWGITLLGGLALAVAVFLIIGFFIWSYTRDINSGRYQEVYDDVFRSSTMAVTPADARRQKMELASAPFLGNPNAPMVVVEFLDFRCPFSREAAPIMKQVAQKFGDRVKIMVRNAPFEELHPHASQLAEIAQCADEQGLYWPVSEALFAAQDKLPDDFTRADLMLALALTNLDWAKVDQCLAAGQAGMAVRRDFVDGLTNGVKGTPTFFINGERVYGVVPFNIWENYFKNN